MENPEEHFQRFCTEYMGAVMKAGRPTRDEIEEVFVAAVADEELEEDVRGRLEGLRTFFKRKLEEKIPLNWFCGEALANVEVTIQVALECKELSCTLAPTVEVKLVGANVKDFEKVEDKVELQENVMLGVLHSCIAEQGPALLGLLRRESALDHVTAEVLERDAKHCRVMATFSGLKGRLFGEVDMTIVQKGDGG